MNVLLRARVQGLGDRGDIVRVADGYARNYLIPRRLAVAATPKIAQQAETMRAKAQLARERERAEAEATAHQLAGIELDLAARASDEGTLFGSITATDIVRAIAEATGVTIEREHVRILAPIKQVGQHPVVIALGHGVDVAITVSVAASER